MRGGSDSSRLRSPGGPPNISGIGMHNNNNRSGGQPSNIGNTNNEEGWSKVAKRQTTGDTSQWGKLNKGKVDPDNVHLGRFKNRRDLSTSNTRISNQMSHISSDGAQSPGNGSTPTSNQSLKDDLNNRAPANMFR